MQTLLKQQPGYEMISFRFALRIWQGIVLTRMKTEEFEPQASRAEGVQDHVTTPLPVLTSSTPSAGI